MSMIPLIPLLPLILAHLLGDFVFQSNGLIKKKYKSWRGTLEHALIITFFTALALAPYWRSSWTWLAIFIIFTVHFSQDVLKVEYDKRYNENCSTKPFFIDQLGHFSLLIIVAYTFKDLVIHESYEVLEPLYFSNAYHLYLIGIILVTYTYDITKFQFKIKREKALVYKPDHLGMLVRLLGFTLIFGLTHFFLSQGLT